jgi:hypothetical protein
MSDGPIFDYSSDLDPHINIMTTNEYIELNSEKHPELVDFAQLDIDNDFTTDFKLEELKSDSQLYEPHIKLEDILLHKSKPLPLLTPI